MRLHAEVSPGNAPIAIAMQDIIAKKSIRLKGIIGIYAANSVGDDIELYADEVLCSLIAQISLADAFIVLS